MCLHNNNIILYKEYTETTFYLLKPLHDYIIDNQ